MIEFVELRRRLGRNLRSRRRNHLATPPVYGAAAAAAALSIQPRGIPSTWLIDKPTVIWDSELIILDTPVRF